MITRQVPYLCAKNLTKVKHGFFGKKGGVSKGGYSSLNCGFSTNDESKNIKKNRNIILNSFDGKILQTVKQVHGIDVIAINNNSDSVSTEADALVTKEKGVMLGVLTADCAPILFFDSKNGVIGAAHAGWRSAFSGVVENTVKKMRDIGANNADIEMAIGPCIQQQSYEIDTVFFEKFLEQDYNNKDFFRSIEDKPHNWLFDLSGYILRRGAGCAGLNLKSLTAMPDDTYKMQDDFFSHRRNNSCGRQLSVIML